MSWESRGRSSSSVSREALSHAARTFMVTGEPEHPVHDLVSIDSPAFGSSDLILSNPSRTRLHIARFCLDGEVHRFLVDSLAFGCWIREMLGVSTRIFRTTATFTLYLFAPQFPESARILLQPVSALFQVELVPYSVVRIAGREMPLIHLLASPRVPVRCARDPAPSSIRPSDSGPREESLPEGLTPEEIVEFERLESLYFGRS